MNEAKQMIVITALNEMMKGGHINICTIDKVAKLLNISIRGSEAYQALSTLHCVDLGAMPPELRAAIPDLVNDCLEMPENYVFKHDAWIDSTSTATKAMRTGNKFLRMLKGTKDPEPGTEETN